MTILANTITADMGFIPGLGLISPLCGVPLSIIAAILERPFYTAAGVDKHTIWYSIRANLMSLLVGYLCILLVPVFYALGPLILAWPVIAVAVSTTIEYRYLKGRIGKEKPLALRPVIAANICSAIACILILIPVQALETDLLKWKLRPYQMPLTILMACICLSAIIAAYVVPARDRRNTAGEIAAAEATIAPAASPPSR